MVFFKKKVNFFCQVFYIIRLSQEKRKGQKMYVDSKNTYTQIYTQEAQRRGYNKELAAGYAKDMQAAQKEENKTTNLAIGVLAGGTAASIASTARKVYKLFEPIKIATFVPKQMKTADGAGAFTINERAVKPVVSKSMAIVAAAKAQFLPFMIETIKVKPKLENALNDKSFIKSSAKAFIVGLETAARGFIGAIKSAPKSAKVVAGVILAGGIINGITQRAAVKGKYDALQHIANNKPAKEEIEEQEPQKTAEEPEIKEAE